MNLYKLLLRIPIFGTIIYITNSYVYGGDPAAISGFARPSLWLKSLLVPVLIAMGLSSLVLWPLLQNFLLNHCLTFTGLSTFSKSPGDLITSIIPSLLGFGIGVYALIFALAGPIIRDLADSIEKLKAANMKREGSALAINADLAYPLTILVLSLVIGIFQKGNSDAWLLILSWVAFWYSLVVTFEVIGVLFGLGDHSILEKLDTTRKADALEKISSSDTHNRQP